MSLGPVVEVLVGLIFMFFVLSVLSSGINEYLARALQKRVDFLAAGVAQLLDHPPFPGADGHQTTYAAEFWRHPLVIQLGQSLEGTELAWHQRLWAWGREPVERALSSRAGQAARLTRLAAEAALPSDEPHHLPSYIPTATFVTVAEQITRRFPPQVGEALQVCLDALADPDPDQYRRNLARWFDNQMDRVSGWYKRDSKTILFALGAVIVVALNADTVAVARTLWKDPTARQVVNQAVQAQLDAAHTTSTTTGDSQAGGTPLQLVCRRSAAAGAGTTTTTSPRDALRATYECATQFPIGWHTSPACYTGPTSPPRVCRGILARPVDVFWTVWRHPTGALAKLVGLLLTAAALSFGAPFWFDLLNRFANLRSTGAKPPPAATTT